MILRSIAILCFGLLLVSCKNKEVKLPVIPAKGLQELHNHSQVWLFFDVKNNDTLVKLNKKNTISSTHWVYNIDKRLPLKAIIPTVGKLKEKHAKSLHSKEGMHDYFSYADANTKKLSFLKFDEVSYTILDSDLNQYSKNETDDEKKQIIKLIFKNNTICINNKIIFPTSLESNLLALLQAKESSDISVIEIQLLFSNDLLYQDYLNYKITINKLLNNSIVLNSNEIIFNPGQTLNCRYY